MKNKYYDTWRFRGIVEIMQTAPFEAVQRFEKYIIEFPLDYSIYPYYVSSLITIGQFDKAEEVYNNVVEAMQNNRKWMHYLKKYESREKVEHLTKNFLLSKIRLLSNQEKYEELNSLLEKHKDLVEALEINSVVFLTKCRSGVLEGVTRDKPTYLFRQIVEYGEEDFLDHIRKHLYEFCDDEFGAVFCKDFPITEVLIEIKKHMIPENAIYYIYDNTYYFKYDGCGKNNGESCNYFKVVCFHNTQNIITIFPVNDCYQLPVIDLNYMKIDEKSPVRKLSRIDKFNKRYGIKQKNIEQ